MSSDEVLREARTAYDARRWADAHAGFTRAADEGSALDADDLGRFARAAYLTGRDEECVRHLEAAFHLHGGAGRAEAAAEAAFWAGFLLVQRGETARGGGWLGLAKQTLGEAPERAVHGLLMLPPALERLMAGDGDAALHRFRRARDIGRRHWHPELTALGGLGTGQAQITIGEVETGLRTLDEVMVGVAGGETSPLVTGLVYCAVIIACHEAYEVGRAAEWTRALSGWCDTQPGLVPFRGQCLVHRAQVLRLHGAWAEATEQIDLARARLSDPPGQPAAGLALYEVGEMHRLRGEHGAAEEAYAASSHCGHDVQPGLALLRLDQGDVAAALAAVRRALAEHRSWRGRAHLEAARVEIALAAGELAEARKTAEAMAATVAAHDTALLRAMAAQARGAVLLADGHPLQALEALRRAVAEWRHLDAPYELSRARLLLGQACRALGDEDTALLEVAAAMALFDQLGAGPDLARVERAGFPAPDARPRSGPDVGTGTSLTARELEVLRAVATGRTNRVIARDLVLSEKTVARHLSNIFAKLDVGSRAAATAYAFEHDLL